MLDNKIFRFGLSAFLLCAIFAYYSYLFFVLDRGFFTDEMFLVQAASNPHYYQIQISFFGYILGPLFEVAGHDLVVYRAIWIVLLSVLFGGFSIVATRFVEYESGRSFDFADRAMAVACIYLATLLSFSYYTGITPGYNSLNFAGSLLFWIGVFLLLAVKKACDSWKVSLVSAVAIATIGIFLSLMSKPTTGVLLAAFGLVLIAVGVFKVPRSWVLLSSIVVLFFLCLIFLSRYPGGGAGFWGNVLEAYKATSTHSGTGILGKTFEDFYFPIKWYWSNSLLLSWCSGYMCLLAGVAGVVLGVSCRRVFWVFTGILFISDLLVTLIFYILDNDIFGWFNVVGWTVQVELPWLLLFFTALIGVSEIRRNLSSSRFELGWIVSLLLLLTPFAVYFGSTARSFSAGAIALVFWVIIFLKASLSTTSRWARLVSAGGAVVLAFVVVWSGWGYAAIRWHVRYFDATHTVMAGIPGTEIRVVPSAHAFYSRLLNLVESNGFERGGDVLALSDTSLALQEGVFVIGGRQLGHPILYGSQQIDGIAERTLNKLPEVEKMNSWVMLESSNEPGKALLGRVGINLEQTHIKVGEVSTSGYLRDKTILVYKPRI